MFFTVQSFLHRANSRSTCGGPPLHRVGSTRRRERAAYTITEWSHQLAHQSESLPYKQTMDLEDEAVDALAQLQGVRNEGGFQWKEAEGESAGTPAARPWRSPMALSDAAGKKKINREGDTINVQAAVQQMQTYLMDNSYIKVYKSDKKHDDATV